MARMGGKYGTGMRGQGGANVQAPPTSPQNGSGGVGVLGSVNLTPAINEISDVRTGRITLGMVNLTILAFVAFYYWTRSAQGGG